MDHGCAPCLSQQSPSFSSACRSVDRDYAAFLEIARTESPAGRGQADPRSGSAYRSAFRRFASTQVLDVTDADKELGQPVILNGLPLTKIHHVAFDAHLIGVDLITEFTSPIGRSKLMMARFGSSEACRKNQLTMRRWRFAPKGATTTRAGLLR
jgi:hypothetical protein